MRITRKAFANGYSRNLLRVASPLLLAVAALLALTSRLPAADYTWTQGSGLGYWSIASNWSPSGPPGSDDNAIFNGNGTGANIFVTNNPTTFIGSITLGTSENLSRTIYNNKTTYTNTLVLNGTNGILLQNLSSSLSLSFGTTANSAISQLGLGGNGEIYVASGATNIMNGPIGDYNGSHGFTMNSDATGLGVLYLYTNNTYSGTTTISNGIVKLSANGTFGNGAGTVNLAGGYILAISTRAGNNIANPMVMLGNFTIYANSSVTPSTRYLPFSGTWGGSSGQLTIENLGAAGTIFDVSLRGGGFNFTQPISIGSGLEVSGASSVLEVASTNGTQTFSGVLSGPGSLLRTAPGGTAGVSILTGNNTYSGGTVINAGTLLANNTAGSALGTSGQVTVTNLSGYQAILGGNGSVGAATSVSLGGTVAPGAYSPNTNIANLNISSLSLGPNAYYVWKISAVAPNPGVNQDQIACSTQWTDAGGPITIQINSMGAVPTGWSSSSNYDWIIIQSGTVNNFNASDFAVDTSSFAGAIAGGWGLYVSGGALHLTYSSGYNLVINVPSGTETQEQAGYSPISGPTNVIKIGNGALVLDNSGNSYSGLTTIQQGTVSLAADALSGSGSLGANSSVTLLGGATSGASSNATLNINTAGVTDAHSITVQAGNSGTKTIETTLTSGTAYFTGDVALNDNATLTAAATGTAVFSGNISGAGGLTLGGGGIITLSGVNTYTGPTAAGGLTLNLNNNALGTNTFTITSPLTLDNTSGANVTLSGSPQNWNADFSFTGSGNLNLGAGPVTLGASRTLTINSNILTVGGAISGNGALTKLGAGTLALQAANTYTGPTTNAAGVIEINAAATFDVGTNLLVLSGGNILDASTRSGAPISNTVLITANARIYGNGALAGTTEERFLPFTGPITATPGAALYVDNLGVSNNYFSVRLVGNNFTNINFPIVVGDTNFDTPGAIEELDLANGNTAPAQVINSVISGPGTVCRAEGLSLTANSGGTAIFNSLNTFSGGALLASGTLGLGTSSVLSNGVVTAGPVGTGDFTIGNGTNENETMLGLFAYGGSQVVANRVILNGNTNIVMTGSNNLTFAGTFDVGGVNKTLDVEGTGLLTISGPITNNAALSKAGPGTLVFSGSNLYTNTTTVLAGTLLVNNTNGSGTGTNTVYVQSGGTLGGSGTVAGPVVATSGNIAPGSGNSSVGELTLGGGLDLSSGGTYVWTLAANSTASPGVNFDVLAATGGSVVLGGSSQLSINFTNSATAPNSSNPFWRTNLSWTILTIGGSASNPGPTQFPTIVNGVYSAGSFTDYADAGGNIILEFIASAPPLTFPKVGSTVLSGTNFVMSGSGGPANHAYYLVSSTNAAAPLAAWTTNATGAFDGVGSFAITNAVKATEPERFFRLMYVYP
jgi:autotransporter-associated beta strand protein